MTTRPAMQFDSLADVREAEIDDENARRALAYPRLVDYVRRWADTDAPARELLRSLGESE
jgi:hypothetical protein